MRDLEAETYRRLINGKMKRNIPSAGMLPPEGIRWRREAQKSFKSIISDIGASLKICKNGFRTRFGG
jgi:hypothetical protein